MRSVLRSFIVLFGSCMLQPALLDQNTLNGQKGQEHWRQEEHLRDAVDRWQMVTPVRTSETGQPYPHHAHYLPRTAPAPDSAPDSAAQPQPMFYSIVAFGEQLRVRLQGRTTFIADDLHTRHVGDNETWLAGGEDGRTAGRHCFWTGSVTGDPRSTVSLSVCHGLLGSIFAFNKHYLIGAEKSNGTANTTDQLEHAKRHVIYQMKKGHQYWDESDTTGPTTEKENLREEQEKAKEGESQRKTTEKADVLGRHRSKRSISMERYVEVMVVADMKMAEYHGKDLQHYILTLMSIVSSIYRDSSIGNSINIVVVKVIVLETQEGGPMITSNAASTLRNFCEWQHAQNEGDDTSPFHHDTAILLTRQDICRSSRKCDTLGLAELGTMCDPKRSCSIIEDNGLSAAFTIAHELGHVFSLPHDDDKLKCKRHQAANSGAMLHVMSPTLDYSTNPWSWSACSTYILTDFLDTGRGECLLDRPNARRYNPALVRRDSRQPGQLYHIDRQCDQVFGSGSVICPYMPVCKRLWCTNPQNSINNGCRTQHMPWADGSTCAPSKVCVHGKCLVPRRGSPVDGSWSRWQVYGRCTRSCGGGVKQAQRLCDSPPPQDGGQYCLGQRIKYKSCNTRNCPTGTMSFRGVQCAEFDGKHFNINGLPPTVKWVPKYSGIASNERCKLFCQVDGSTAYYLLHDKVHDGTKCSAHTDDICVHGKCQKAGCDNQLGSSIRRDKCGVCGGDSSTCKTIFRAFNEVRYGYHVVVRLPRGATNVDIQQRGHHNLKKDDNYLALRSASGEYLLNGNFVVSMFRKEMNMKGTLVEYSGSDNVIERINSTDSLQEDMDLLVLSVGELHPPDITYTYTVSQQRPDQYVWSRKKGKWSRCDRPCQGYKRRRLVCINSMDRSRATDTHCKNIRKPKEIRKRCHVHCSVRWQIVEQGECSVRCGVGVLNRKVKCLKIKRHRPKYVKDRHCAQLNRKPPSSIRCQGLCLRSHWKYSRWNRCSKPCGGGTQERTARCVNSRNETANERECGHRRQTRRRCKKSPCTNWQAGKWSECAGSCGNAYRQRQLWCLRGNSAVNKSQCRHTKAPLVKEGCSLKSCPSWYTGFWARCSASCGEGVKRRPVLCRSSVTGREVRDDQCVAAERPPAQTACEGLPACPHSRPRAGRLGATAGMDWRVGSWTQCSETCGAGTRERYVSCRDAVGNRADNSRCERTPKPDSREACLDRPCGYWRTGDWTGCSVTCGAGVETRLVACVSLEQLETQVAAVTASTQCDVAVKPSGEKSCNLHSCHRGYNIASISSNRVVGTAHWRVGSWGQCSVTCGGSGWQRRRVLCQDENGPSSRCDPETRPTEMEHCGSEDCPRWSYGDWGQCSVSCGPGQQKRVVVCRRQNGETLADGRCDAAAKPSSTQACRGPSQCRRHTGSSRQTAYDKRGQRITQWSSWSSWSSSQWSQYGELRARSPVTHTKTVQPPPASASAAAASSTMCSVSCGAGHKTRQVTCLDAEGRPQDESLCASHSRRPRSVRRCRHGHCPHWRPLPWQQCSVTCGTGVRQRSMECIGHRRGVVVADAMCARVPEPASTEPCHMQDCSLFQWRVAAWSQCSISCGLGVKHREIFCINSATNKEVGKYNCDETGRPKVSDDCQQAACEAEWVAGDWSKCSRSCGGGQQQRAVTCQAVSREGWLLPAASDACDDARRPAQIRLCSQVDCHLHHHWHATSWGKCSQECGHGVSERKVFCFDIKTRTVMTNSKKCLASAKPETSQPCYRRPCYAASCQELRETSLLQEDGEYRLYVKGQFLLVYCKNMRSHPTEYITLPAGESENFSEIYDKRLQLPESCPSNGERMSPCKQCTGKTYRRAGVTRFSKVRFNITSLEVILNDFEFSSTSGAKQVPFATAGDCYSTQDCPQGTFRVNLSGTSLKMVSTSTWKNSGYRVSQQITVSEMQQVIDGKCGGYCGRCSPASNALQLTLLP